jgi:hypothetical protein
VSPTTNAAYGVNHLCDARRGRLMADPVEDIIGDYWAFAARPDRWRLYRVVSASA